VLILIDAGFSACLSRGTNRRVEVLIEGCRFASATSGTGATTAGPGLGAGAQAGLGALGAAALIGALSGGGTTSTGTTGGT
ncbi:hypothetical protein ACFTOW_09275, partial [Lacimonas salitolerans]